MEPNKLEQDIKKKLDTRSINPTPMAWDRLDAMLTVAEKKEPKKKPLVMWLSIAACFLGLLFTGLFFLNQENDSIKGGINNGATIVAAPDKEVEIKKPSTTEQEVIIETAAPVTEAPIAANTKKVTTKAQYKTLTVKSRPAPGLPRVEPLNDEVVVSTPDTDKPTDLLPSKIKVDANALLASVDSHVQPNAGTNNIAVANPDIKQPKLKVNANTLLTSVEGELDQSFRGKVINSIQKNYNAVKTAVVTRNRE